MQEHILQTKGIILLLILFLQNKNGGIMKKKDLYDIALDEIHMQDKRNQEKRDQEAKRKNEGEKESPTYEY